MRFASLFKCLLAGLTSGIVAAVLWIVVWLAVPVFTAFREAPSAAGEAGSGGGGLRLVEVWGTGADLILPLIAGFAVGFVLMFRRQRRGIRLG